MFNNINQIKRTLNFEILHLNNFLKYIDTKNENYEYYKTELDIREILLQKINKGEI